jgi:hypothetical protein
MNDLLVTIPVVKLTSMTHNAPPVTMTVNTKDMPPPCDIQPRLPPPEPPPLDVVPGKDEDGNGGHPHYFPVGSIADDKDITCPCSPATPFEFPFDHTGDQYFDSVIATLLDLPSTMDSVTCVITTPHVCGLNGDAQSRVWKMSTDMGTRFFQWLMVVQTYVLQGHCHSSLIPYPFLPCQFLWWLRERGHPLPIVELNLVYSRYNSWTEWGILPTMLLL